MALLKFLFLVGSATSLRITEKESPSPGIDFAKQGIQTGVSINQQQLDYVSSQLIESNCKVTIETATKTVFLDSSLGKFTLKDGQFFDESGNNATQPAKALVCLGNAEAPDDGPALFMAASDAKYLWKGDTQKGGQGHPIDFFLNKHCWAKNNNVQYYFWFGSPQDENGFMTQKDPDALPCKDGKPGNHYFIIAGMRELLMTKKNSWIVSMDISDTFFDDRFAHRNMLDKFLDDRFDFIGGATGGGNVVFINGAIVAYKRSAWATNFAAEWFKNRCGGMNQLAMWNSLFKLWKQEVPTFDYDLKHMESYWGGGGWNKDGPCVGKCARNYARAHSANLLTVPEQQEAMKTWRRNGKLKIALEYPHVKVYGNVGDGGIDGVTWRADMNHTASSFMCHNTMDRSRNRGCNARHYMCGLPEQCQC